MHNAALSPRIGPVYYCFMSCVVWESVLDKKYTVKVARTAPYRGALFIMEGPEILFSTAVGLSRDALFGPNAADVDAWCGIAKGFMDSLRPVN